MTERELLGKLNSIRLRARLMLLLYGVGLLAAVVVAGFLLPVLVDWAIRLPGPVRLAITICLLVVLGYSLWRFLWLPIRARITLDDVALKLEARFPQFNDRLASAVNFITHPAEQGDVSPVLVREVVRDSGDSTRNVPLGKVLTAKATSMGMLIGLVGVAALLVVLVVSPDWARTGFKRMFLPLSDVQWPHRYTLLPLSGAKKVPVGDSFTAKMQILNGGSPEAFVKYKKGDKDWQTEKMQTRKEDGKTVYFAEEPFRNLQADESFTYYFVVSEGFYLDDREVRSGDYTVAVVPRPRVDSASYKIIYPDYMNQAPKSGEAGSGRTINVRRDSTLQVDMVLDTRQSLDPLGAKGRFTLKYTPRLPNGKTGPTTQREVQKIAGAPNAYRFEATVGESFQVEPMLEDNNGFNNQYPGYTALYVVDSVADKRPDVGMHIKVEGINDRARSEDLEVEPDATLKISYWATDDNCVVATERVLRRGQKDTKDDAFDAIAPELTKVTTAKVKDESGEDRFKVEGTELIRLADLGVKVDDVLQVRGRATDNSNPQNLTDTFPQKIRVISLEQEAAKYVRQLPEQIRGLMQAETAINKDTLKLLDQLNVRPPNGDDVRELDNLSDRQAGVRGEAAKLQEKFDDLANRMRDKKLDNQSLKDQVDKIKESMGEVKDTMKKAEEDLARAANAISPARGKPAPASQPSDAKPSDAKPSDAKPSDAKPSDAKPSDAKPSDAKPSDAKPSDAKPSDAKPSDAKPSDAKPSDAKPSDAKPSDAKPSDAKPSDAKPSDSKPSDSKPSDSKPSDSKPSDSKSNPSPKSHTKDASDNEKKSIGQMKDIIKNVEQYSSLADILKELERILKAQQSATKSATELAPTTLGKTVEQLEAAVLTRLHDLERGQSDLGSDSRKVLSEMDRVAETIAAADPGGARALKEAANIGDQEQLVEKQLSAATSVAQVHLDEAIGQDRAAEAVLTAMIDVLKTRHEREMAEIQKKLNEILQAIEKLIEQENKHIANNEDAQKKDAANDEFKKQAKAQEGTKGNTDQVAEDLKGLSMAEAVKSAGQASDSMAQAAGKLDKSGKPSGQKSPAGQPPKDSASPASQPEDKNAKDAQKDQQKSVEYLEDTKNKVKDKLDELAKKEADEKRAKLIEMLTAIRERQVKDVNDPTEATFKEKPKEDDLTRLDLADLTKVAGKQQEIHKDTSKISADVKKESVVISWLLEKVVSGMGESLKGLNGQLDLPDKPGRRGHDLKQVRAEQIALVNQLNELINALEEEKKNAEAQPPPPPGGGGGGGKPKPQPLVPTVAELKLLRSMQKNVLDRTVDVDKQIIPNQPNPAAEKKVKRLGDDENKIRDLTIDMVKKLQSNGGGGSPPDQPAVDPKKVQDQMRKLNPDDGGKGN